MRAPLRYSQEGSEQRDQEGNQKRLAFNFYRKSVRSKMPKDKELEAHTAKARELKSAEVPFQGMIKHFRQKGLPKDIAEKIIIMADSDQ